MRIDSERLILRPFCENDAEDMLEYLSKPTVNCFLDMALASLNEAQLEARKRSKDREYYFAICLRDSNKVIGEIFAHPDENAKDSFSPCWMLNANFQGKGYAYEAARAFFNYLFTEKGARRIYAYTEDYNLSSQKLCEKLHMRKEGLFLEYISFVKNPDGSPRYENTYQYAILKKEWVEKENCLNK